MQKLCIHLSIVLCLVCSLLSSAQAQTSSLLGNYYILSSNHVDTGRGVDSAIVSGLVNSTLSSNFLPTVSTFGMNRTTGSGGIKDVNANGELLWWGAHTATAGNVTFDKSQTDTVATLASAYASNFYPTGKANNSTGYRAVHWQGTFNQNAVGSVTFTLGPDDDSWLFLDGQLVVDDGGVHANQSAQNVLNNISIGSHRIDLFFADRHTTGSGITFNSSVVLTPPTPEPGISIFALSAFGILCAVRIRKTARK